MFKPCEEATIILFQEERLAAKAKVDPFVAWLLIPHTL
jgi:hypothetical protein